MARTDTVLIAGRDTEQSRLDILGRSTNFHVTTYNINPSNKVVAKMLSTPDNVVSYSHRNTAGSGRTGAQDLQSKGYGKRAIELDEKVFGARMHAKIGTYVDKESGQSRWFVGTGNLTGGLNKEVNFFMAGSDKQIYNEVSQALTNIEHNILPENSEHLLVTSKEDRTTALERTKNLIEFGSGALYIASATLSHPDIVKAIEKRAKTGDQVYVLLGGSKKDQNAEQVKAFEPLTRKHLRHLSNLHISYSTNPFHANIIVSGDTILEGSTRYSKSGLSGSRGDTPTEISLLMKDSRAVKAGIRVIMDNFGGTGNFPVVEEPSSKLKWDQWSNYMPALMSAQADVSKHWSYVIDTSELFDYDMRQQYYEQRWRNRYTDAAGVKQSRMAPEPWKDARFFGGIYRSIYRAVNEGADPTQIPESIFKLEESSWKQSAGELLQVRIAQMLGGSPDSKDFNADRYRFWHDLTRPRGNRGPIGTMFVNLGAILDKEGNQQRQLDVINSFVYQEPDAKPDTTYIDMARLVADTVGNFGMYLGSYWLGRHAMGVFTDTVTRSGYYLQTLDKMVAPPPGAPSAGPGVRSMLSNVFAGVKESVFAIRRFGAEVHVATLESLKGTQEAVMGSAGKDWVNDQIRTMRTVTDPLTGERMTVHARWKAMVRATNEFATKVPFLNVFTHALGFHRNQDLEAVEFKKREARQAFWEAGWRDRLNYLRGANPAKIAYQPLADAQRQLTTARNNADIEGWMYGKLTPARRFSARAVRWLTIGAIASRVAGDLLSSQGPTLEEQIAGQENLIKPLIDKGGTVTPLGFEALRPRSIADIPGSLFGTLIYGLAWTTELASGILQGKGFGAGSYATRMLSPAKDVGGQSPVNFVYQAGGVDLDVHDPLGSLVSVASHFSDMLAATSINMRLAQTGAHKEMAFKTLTKYMASSMSVGEALRNAEKAAPAVPADQREAYLGELAFLNDRYRSLAGQRESSDVMLSVSRTLRTGDMLGISFMATELIQGTKHTWHIGFLPPLPLAGSLTVQPPVYWNPRRSEKWFTRWYGASPGMQPPGISWGDSLIKRGIDSAGGQDSWAGNFFYNLYGFGYQPSTNAEALFKLGVASTQLISAFTSEVFGDDGMRTGMLATVGVSAGLGALANSLAEKRSLGTGGPRRFEDRFLHWLKTGQSPGMGLNPLTNLGYIIGGDPNRTFGMRRAVGSALRFAGAVPRYLIDAPGIGIDLVGKFVVQPLINTLHPEYRGEGVRKYNYDEHMFARGRRLVGGGLVLGLTALVIDAGLTRQKANYEATHGGLNYRDTIWSKENQISELVDGIPFAGPMLHSWWRNMVGIDTNQDDDKYLKRAPWAGPLESTATEMRLRNSQDKRGLRGAWETWRESLFGVFKMFSFEGLQGDDYGFGPVGPRGTVTVNGDEIQVRKMAGVLSMFNFQYVERAGISSTKRKDDKHEDDLSLAVALAADGKMIQASVGRQRPAFMGKMFMTQSAAYSADSNIRMALRVRQQLSSFVLGSNAYESAKYFGYYQKGYRKPYESEAFTEYTATLLQADGEITKQITFGPTDFQTQTRNWTKFLSSDEGKSLLKKLKDTSGDATRGFYETFAQHNAEMRAGASSMEAEDSALFGPPSAPGYVTLKPNVMVRRPGEFWLSGLLNKDYLQATTIGMAVMLGIPLMIRLAGRLGIDTLRRGITLPGGNVIGGLDPVSARIERNLPQKRSAIRRTILAPKHSPDGTVFTGDRVKMYALEISDSRGNRVLLGDHVGRAFTDSTFTDPHSVNPNRQHLRSGERKVLGFKKIYDEIEDIYRAQLSNKSPMRLRPASMMASNVVDRLLHIVEHELQPTTGATPAHWQLSTLRDQLQKELEVLADDFKNGRVSNSNLDRNTALRLERITRTLLDRFSSVANLKVLDQTHQRLLFSDGGMLRKLGMVVSSANVPVKDKKRSIGLPLPGQPSRDASGNILRGWGDPWTGHNDPTAAVRRYQASIAAHLQRFYSGTTKHLANPLKSLFSNPLTRGVKKFFGGALGVMNVASVVGDSLSILAAFGALGASEGDYTAEEKQRAQRIGGQSLQNLGTAGLFALAGAALGTALLPGLGTVGGAAAGAAIGLSTGYLFNMATSAIAEVERGQAGQNKGVLASIFGIAGSWGRSFGGYFDRSILSIDNFLNKAFSDALVPLSKFGKNIFGEKAMGALADRAIGVESFLYNMILYNVETWLNPKLDGTQNHPFNKFRSALGSGIQTFIAQPLGGVSLDLASIDEEGRSFSLAANNGFWSRHSPIWWGPSRNGDVGWIKDAGLLEMSKQISLRDSEHFGASLTDLMSHESLQLVGSTGAYSGSNDNPLNINYRSLYMSKGRVGAAIMGNAQAERAFQWKYAGAIDSIIYQELLRRSILYETAILGGLGSNKLEGRARGTFGEAGSWDERKRRRSTGRRPSTPNDYLDIARSLIDSSGKGTNIGPQGAPQTWDPYFRNAAQKYKVDEGVLRTIAWIETRGSYNVEARSPKDARGPMQIMPFNLKDGENPYDPETAIMVAARVYTEQRNALRRITGREPSLVESVMAYNSGAGAVGKLAENREYRKLFEERYYGSPKTIKDPKALAELDKFQQKIHLKDSKYGGDLDKFLAGEKFTYIKADDIRRSMNERGIWDPYDNAAQWKRINPKVGRTMTPKQKAQWLAAEFGLGYDISAGVKNMPTAPGYKGRISSTFGHRSSPGGVGSTYHEGIDIVFENAEKGSFRAPVLARDGGTVTFAGWRNGYGYSVDLQVGKTAKGESIVYRYGHADSLSVTKGDVLARGQEIMRQGATGHATGVHTHFGVYVGGKAVDPFKFLRDTKTDAAGRAAQLAMEKAIQENKPLNQVLQAGGIPAHLSRNKAEIAERALVDMGYSLAGTKIYEEEQDKNYKQALSDSVALGAMLAGLGAIMFGFHLGKSRRTQDNNLMYRDAFNLDLLSKIADLYRPGIYLEKGKYANRVASDSDISDLASNKMNGAAVKALVNALEAAKDGKPIRYYRPILENRFMTRGTDALDPKSSRSILRHLPGVISAVTGVDLSIQEIRLQNYEAQHSYAELSRFENRAKQVRTVLNIREDVARNLEHLVSRPNLPAESRFKKQDSVISLLRGTIMESLRTTQTTAVYRHHDSMDAGLRNLMADRALGEVARRLGLGADYDQWIVQQQLKHMDTRKSDDKLKTPGPLSRQVSRTQKGLLAAYATTDFKNLVGESSSTTRDQALQRLVGVAGDQRGEAWADLILADAGLEGSDTDATRRRLALAYNTFSDKMRRASGKAFFSRRREDKARVLVTLDDGRTVKASTSEIEARNVFRQTVKQIISDHHTGTVPAGDLRTDIADPALVREAGKTGRKTNQRSLQNQNRLEVPRSGAGMASNATDLLDRLIKVNADIHGIENNTALSGIAIIDDARGISLVDGHLALGSETFTLLDDYLNPERRENLIKEDMSLHAHETEKYGIERATELSRTRVAREVRLAITQLAYKHIKSSLRSVTKEPLSRFQLGALEHVAQLGLGELFDKLGFRDDDVFAVRPRGSRKSVLRGNPDVAYLYGKIMSYLADQEAAKNGWDLTTTEGRRHRDQLAHKLARRGLLNNPRDTQRFLFLELLEAHGYKWDRLLSTSESTFEKAFEMFERNLNTMLDKFKPGQRSRFYWLNKTSSFVRHDPGARGVGGNKFTDNQLNKFFEKLSSVFSTITPEPISFTNTVVPLANTVSVGAHTEIVLPTLNSTATPTQARLQHESVAPVRTPFSMIDLPMLSATGFTVPLANTTPLANTVSSPTQTAIPAAPKIGRTNPVGDLGVIELGPVKALLLGLGSPRQQPARRVNPVGNLGVIELGPVKTLLLGPGSPARHLEGRVNPVGDLGVIELGPVKALLLGPGSPARHLEGRVNPIGDLGVIELGPASSFAEEETSRTGLPKKRTFSRGEGLRVKTPEVPVAPTAAPSTNKFWQALRTGKVANSQVGAAALGLALSVFDVATLLDKNATEEERSRAKVNLGINVGATAADLGGMALQKLAAVGENMAKFAKVGGALRGLGVLGIVAGVGLDIKKLSEAKSDREKRRAGLAVATGTLLGVVGLVASAALGAAGVGALAATAIVSVPLIAAGLGLAWLDSATRNKDGEGLLSRTVGRRVAKTWDRVMGTRQPVTLARTLTQTVPTPVSYPKPSMLDMPTDHYSERKNGEDDISTIIIHHTGSSLQSTLSSFRSREGSTSSHYVVARDGRIIQMVDDSKAAWHAGVSGFKGRDFVNEFSIGIELVKEADQHNYTEEQYNSLSKLTSYLSSKYKVPLENIVGHKDIAFNERLYKKGIRKLGRKSDPENFDWKNFKSSVYNSVTATLPRKEAEYLTASRSTVDLAKLKKEKREQLEKSWPAVQEQANKDLYANEAGSASDWATKLLEWMTGKSPDTPEVKTPQKAVDAPKPKDAASPTPAPAAPASVRGPDKKQKTVLLSPPRQDSLRTAKKDPAQPAAKPTKPVVVVKNQVAYVKYEADPRAGRRDPADNLLRAARRDSFNTI